MLGAVWVIEVNWAVRAVGWVVGAVPKNPALSPSWLRSPVRLMPVNVGDATTHKSFCCLECNCQLLPS